MDIPQTTPTQNILSVRLRPWFVGLLSGFLAGMAGAFIARMMMRAVAEFTTGTSHFSIGGTANIFLFAALLGPLLGAIYVPIRPRLPVPVRLKGLVYALILMALFQLPLLQLIPEFRAEVMASGGLGLLVFALINIFYSANLAAIIEAVDERVPDMSEGSGSGVVIGTAILGLLALGGAGVLLVQIVGRLIGAFE